MVLKDGNPKFTASFLLTEEIIQKQPKPWIFGELIVGEKAQYIQLTIEGREASFIR